MRKGLLFGMAVLFMIIFAIAGCKTKEVSVEKSYVEPTKPTETQAETIQELPETEETSAETEMKESEKETTETEEVSASNIETISQRTILGTAGQAEKTIIEGESWFSNIVCGKLFSDGESYLSFTFENNDKKDYVLTSVRYDEREEKNPAIIQVNGRDFRENPKEVCNAEEIKAGEKINCKMKVQLRKGRDAWGKELINKIEAGAMGFNTELKFKCEGMQEEKTEQAEEPAEQAIEEESEEIIE